jgi:histidinol-phosphate aminotransferase
MSIAALARPEIRVLTPYASARMEAGRAGILLNANESPWASAAALNRYPDPQPLPLVEALADMYGVAPDCVLVGRGSDEAIDLLVRAFCAAGRDAIAICPPTFGMYAVSARIQGAAVVEVPLTADFAVDIDALLAAITGELKLVFLCSPNNPTGGCMPIADIVTLLEALVGRALVVVDEAYIEYAGTASAVGLLAAFDNLAVLRTLSKAFALASARVGAVMARPEVITLLRRIQAPYPLPQPCIAAAMGALDPAARAETDARIACIRRERERVKVGLEASPTIRDVLPSAANFLCVRVDAAGETYRTLVQSGILVRDVSRYQGLENCLRITIGTPEENDRLLDALLGRNLS